MVITDKKSCSGCRACQEICPKSCITMELDEEYFYYPKIDSNTCINCKLCEKVCPINGAIYNKIDYAVAGVHKDKDIVKNSSSGGAFSALVKNATQKGYVVFGTTYDENLKVVTEAAYSYEEAMKFRKSKYVQGDTNGVFSKIKHMLKNGEKVLFSGTPCQVAALKNFIKDKQADILYVDIICHGVASQDSFDAELEYLKKKYGSDVESFTFKNKEKFKGVYNSRSAKVKIKNRKKAFKWDYESDPYLRGYYTNLFHRPSCSSCPFANSERVGDITLGDAWGIEKLKANMNSVTSGVSLILVNTTKGKEFFEECKEQLDYVLVDVDWAINNNQQLRHPMKENINRNAFFENFKHEDFGKLVFRLTKKSLYKKTLGVLIRIRNIIRCIKEW